MSKISRSIIKIIFNFLCIVIIFGTIGLLIWRISSMEVPRDLKELDVNEQIATAYVENGKKLTLLYQSQDKITRADHNSGYFSVPYATFITEAEQLQLVFRYNNSTLKYLAEDYGLENVPSRESDCFELSLIVVTDLTPDNIEDNNTNSPESSKEERFFPTEISKRDSSSIYNYRKFIFDGIKLEKNVLAVYVDFHYKEDVDYEKDAYGTLCLYDYKTENEYRTLSSSVKKKIESFGK